MMRLRCVHPQARALLSTWGALAAVVATGLPALSPCAQAQVVVAPETVAVSVPRGQTATATLTLSNTTAESVRLALSLAPTDADPGDGTQPGDYLFTSPNLLSPTAVAALPDGRVFVTASNFRFSELTAELDFIREFDHPTDGLVVGLTYNADARSPLSANPGEGTLWWMEIDVSGGQVVADRLVEGTLGDPTAPPNVDAYDSQATGRGLPVEFAPAASCSYPAGRPAMLAYDAASTPTITGGLARFYWLDIAHDAVWASDTLGSIIEGYPKTLTDYKRTPWGDPDGATNEAECLLGTGLDAHALSTARGPDGSVLPGEPIFEVMVGFQQELPFNRASRSVVTDREGNNRGAETPLVDLPIPPGGQAVRELVDVVRSRVDPSVLYVVLRAGPSGPGAQEVVYGVRAALLPPRWLHAERVLWALGASGTEEESVEAGLRFETDGLAVGTYEGVVAVRLGDGIGPVVAEVPVTFTVTEGTSAEDAAEPGESAVLAVYPNPTRSQTLAMLTLTSASDVSVAVYDVLGRRVAVLHDGLLAAGEHTFPLATSGLPAGVYLVRAEGEEWSRGQSVSILH